MKSTARKVEKKHFVFGYGSLIHHLSRSRTLKNETHGVPVYVNGFSRSWSYNCKNNYTAVAVSRDYSKGCNGVLFPIENPHQDLKVLDEREANYSRKRLSLSDIIPRFDQIPAKNSNVIWNYLSSIFNENSVVWVYVSDSKHVPCSKTPIPQSYLDCIIDGCLEYSIEFALEFLETTQGWKNGPWMNDRNKNNQRYQPDTSYNYNLIDQILWSSFPHAMESRV